MITLNDGQNKVIVDLQEFYFKSLSSFFVLNGYAGVGKLQPLTEPVLTPSGFKPMGKIVKGSEIMAADGTITTVEQVFPQDDLNIYKVTFSDGTFTECCDDHLWKVQTKKQGTRDNWSVLPLSKLLPKIAEGARFTSGGSNKGYAYFIPLCQPVQFPTKRLPIDPYVLGYILGNGHSPSKKNHIVLSMWNEDVLEIVHSLNQSSECLLDKVAVYGNVTRKWLVPEAVESYKALGLKGLLSNAKFVPEDYLLGDVSQRRALLAGLMDSDGTGSGGKLRFSTASHKLADAVVYLVQSLGGVASKTVGALRDSGNFPEIQVSLRVSQTPFWLKRKEEAANLPRKNKHRFVKQIVSAEFLGRKPGQCIRVAHPDHLYLTRSFIVTHNTTSINYAIQAIREASPHNIRVCFTAPTNKATKVLRRMAYDLNLDVECKTVYSLLGLVLNSNNEIRRTAKMANGSFEDYDLVVVDEASMLGEELFSALESSALTYRVKVVLMGDQCQLGAVNDAGAGVFSKDYPSGSLTQIMRQKAKNPILTLAQTIRDAQTDNYSEIVYNEQINPESGQGIHLLSRPDWIDCIKENFASDEYKYDPDSFRCLSYTNARVASLNRVIRDMLVGKTESPFVVGERVLAKKPITDPDDSDLRIHTDEECEVMSVEKVSHPKYLNTSVQFQVWETRLLTESDVIVTAYLLHANSRGDYKSFMNTLSQLANKDGGQWKNFWAFKDSFADLQSPHAITIHRAQGSTYKNVFLDIKDVYTNRRRLERLQLEYVAVSRASESLIITK